MVIAMSFCYRFFANLSSYIPSFSALVLFILSSHCHFAFPCVLVFFFLSVLCIYFVHIFHDSEFLFEVLTCTFSGCPKDQYSLPAMV